MQHSSLSLKEEIYLEVIYFSEPTRSESRSITLPRLLGILVGIFVVTTIIFATFYGIEKSKKTVETTITPTVTTVITTVSTTTVTITTSNGYNSLFLLRTTNYVFAAQRDLCLTPYCIKAGEYLLFVEIIHKE